MSSTLEATLDATTNTSSAGRPDHGVERGTVIGRYVVLAELGAGGMGLVYAAYDPELDRKVAIKLVRSTDDTKSTTSRGHARLVREAQALARLDHPNVVTVHDVGTFTERVWIAMEFVDGQTLAAWARAAPRSWRDVISVLQPALRGLAAAHAAGITHRDIKPDNIMVCHDAAHADAAARARSVRLMDFGLALAQPDSEPPSFDDTDGGARSSLALRVTRGGVFPGTPAYMSPEQFRGDPVDAKSDQFACCVVLWELLFGERPFPGTTIAEVAAAVFDGRRRAPRPDRKVPAWLRRICERGLSLQPSRRFASIDALLEAIERGQAIGRRRAWIVGAAALVVAAGGVQLWRAAAHAGRVAACDEAGASIQEVWNDESRTRVRASLIATGVGHAAVTADRVVPWLDRRAEEWQQQRTLACTNAEIDHTWDARTTDTALWCLDERRLRLGSLVATLSEADVDVASRAVGAAANLPSAAPCVDDAVIARLPAPPPIEARASVLEVREALARAEALAAAGKSSAALSRARTGRERAEVIGWPALVAAAKRVESRLHLEIGEFADAEVLADDAYVAAASVGAWDVAAESAGVLVRIVGVELARPIEGRAWAKHAAIAIGLAGDPLGTREQARLDGLAGVEHATGNFAEAKRLRKQALALAEESLGPDHPGISQYLNNLAVVQMTLAETDEAKALFQRALAIDELQLGPDHPGVVFPLINLGGLAVRRGDFSVAREWFERALAIQEDVLGAEHYQVGRTILNLAIVCDGMGMYEEARDLDERALAIIEKAVGPEHVDVASAAGNLGNVYKHLKDLPRAKALHERALAIRENALGPDHPLVGQSLGNLANVLEAMGETSQARALAERALAVREKAFGPEHPDVANALQYLGSLEVEAGHGARGLELLERALAIYDAHEGVQEGELSARFLHATTLATTGGDMTLAREQAERVRDGFREAGRASDARDVEAWLAAHPK